MKSNTRRVRSVAVVTVMAAGLALSACGSDDSSAGEDDTFNLVAVLSISGPLAESGGIPSRQSLETGVKILNEGGGIDGRTVKLTTVDGASDATKGVANLQAYLADNPKPDAVFGGQYSFEALPMAPITTQAEVLSMSSSVTPVLDDPEKFPYTFQQSIPPATIIGALASHLVDEGYKKVAYIAVDDESGHTSVDAFSQVADSEGLELVDGYIPADSVDATSVLEKLRAADPDVLVMSAVGPAAATMLKSRTDIGWDIPAVGDGAAFAANDLGKISEPEYWDGVTVQAAAWNVEGSYQTTTPAFERFKEAYEAEYEVNVGFGGLVALYQSLITIKAAYEATDQNDAASLAKALEDLGEDTIPDSIEDTWIGPKGLGFSAEHHSNQSWGNDDFTFVPAQALEGGMWPSSKG